MEFSFSRLWIIAKITLLISLIILIPKLISEKEVEIPVSQMREKFLLGISNLLTHPEQFKALKKLRLGVISLKKHDSDHHVKSVQQLSEHGFTIKKIFLYGALPLKEDEEQLHEVPLKVEIPRKVMNQTVTHFSDFTLLDIKNEGKDIDAFVLDIPFYGLRCDPVVAVLTDLLKVSAVHHKQVIVLDRPNPLGGVIEGPGVIPLRCGATLGELALCLNNSFARKADLLVVPMLGWNRQMTKAIFTAADLNQKKCYGYGLSVLFGAIQPLDIGMTTSDAYYLIALPKTAALSDWETHYLKKICLDFGLDFTAFEYYQKNKKLNYKGIKLHAIKDQTLFSSFNSFLTITKFLLNRKQVTLSFSQGFDSLIGSSDVKNYLLGYMPFEKLKKNVEESMSLYFEKLKQFLLYAPSLKMSQVCLFNGAHD